MANKKTNGSIDDNAYEALEAALRIDFDENEIQAPRKRSAPDAPEARVSDTSSQRSASAKQSTDRRSRGTENGQAEMVGRASNFEPANDTSRRSPSALMKSIEGASARAALRNATIASTAWVAGALGLGYLVYGDLLASSTSLTDVAAVPGVVALGVGTVVPVMLFYAFSIMMARAHDLRNAARSMAEVALRLAEPETVASERIMTVGQAVRREVSAMN